MTASSLRRVAIALCSTSIVVLSMPYPAGATARGPLPVGTVTECALPTDFDGRGVATGPDEGIWATSLGSTLPGVGRFDLATASFTMVTNQGGEAPAAYPEITAGPDGNLWYTDWRAAFRSSCLFSRAALTLRGRVGRLLALAAGEC